MGHMSKWCYYPLRMLIALAWTVAISAPGPRFLTKWSSLWVRLRCQSELYFNYPPAWPVAPGREECDSPAFPSDPPLSKKHHHHPAHPTLTAATALWASCLGLGLVQVAVSPATSSQFCKYVLDMAGMSHAHVPVAGDKFDSKEMSWPATAVGYIFTRCPTVANLHSTRAAPLLPPPQCTLQAAVNMPATQILQPDTPDRILPKPIGCIPHICPAKDLWRRKTPLE